VSKVFEKGTNPNSLIDVVIEELAKVKVILDGLGVPVIPVSPCGPVVPNPITPVFP
jgi:hypothetical protein